MVDRIDIHRYLYRSTDKHYRSHMEMIDNQNLQYKGKETAQQQTRNIESIWTWVEEEGRETVKKITRSHRFGARKQTTDRWRCRSPRSTEACSSRRANNHTTCLTF